MMDEIIEMSYGTGKTVGLWTTLCLTSYPPQYRYECSKCHSQVKEPSKSCPNCKAEMKFFPEDFFKAYSEVQLDVEIDEESEDDGTADDMGLEKISCKQCRYILSTKNI